MHIDVRAHRPRGLTPRRDAGLYAYEHVLERAGLGPVAGVDEAGRGACAGPLVVAAVILPPDRRRRIEGLADSKLLTAARRERLYGEITAIARAWTALVIPREDIDRIGLHRCNIAGMRRALAGLNLDPGYVLTDGFRVPGICAPALPVPKGDQVSACVAAASIVAKVTRDRIMRELHERYPMYGFGDHKGYITRAHAAALEEHGPCPEHRISFINVARLLAGEPVSDTRETPTGADAGEDPLGELDEGVTDARGASVVSGADEDLLDEGKGEFGEVVTDACGASVVSGADENPLDGANGELGEPVGDAPGASVGAGAGENPLDARRGELGECVSDAGGASAGTGAGQRPSAGRRSERDRDAPIGGEIDWEASDYEDTAGRADVA